MVLTEERPADSRPKGSLRVVRQSEFLASCDCEDFWRSKDHDQERRDFASRKARSRGIRVVSVEARYGMVAVRVETADKRGARAHEVMLGRGDGDGCVCKHIIRALRSSALMPDRRNKTVVFSEDAARNLARMYAGRMVKMGRMPDAIVTSVNNVYVVGWRKELEKAEGQ